MKPKHQKHRVWLWSIAVVLLLLLITAAAYLLDYSHASPEATALAANAPKLSDGTLVFGAENARAGVIFYPGGKVASAAYAPLMTALAQKGFLCLLVEMPFHLAVFDVNAADGLPAQFPNVRRWYIAGHSLGGSMAAEYAANHADALQGLILLAAYSTADLTGSGLPVLSVYGSADTVLNRERLARYAQNLPANAQTVVLEGGCHAYFGDYGTQKGDGTPTLTRAGQMEATVAAIAAFAGTQP